MQPVRFAICSRSPAHKFVIVAGLLLIPFAFTQDVSKNPDVERRESFAHEANVVVNKKDWTTMTVQCGGENETELVFALPKETWAPGSMGQFAQANIMPIVQQLKVLGFKSVRLSGAQLTPTDSTGEWMLRLDDPEGTFRNSAPALNRTNPIQAAAAPGPDLAGQSKEYCRNFPQSEACAGHISTGKQVSDKHFSFKGNALRMSLDDFRALPSNRAPIWINIGDPAKKLDKSKSQQVFTPLCSDQYSIGPKDLPPGEVTCMTGTPGHYGMSFKKGGPQREGGINEQSLLVAGHDPDDAWYYFYEGKLYKIRIGRFVPEDFADILEAFEQKLGPPTQITKTDYQNGFGAKWQSSIVVWRDGDNTITLVEGPGTGPGQDHYNRYIGPSILFLDEAVAKKLPASDPTKVDF